jgi:hypothetical protein
MAQLITLSDGAEGRPIRLGGKRFTLGRAADNALPLDDKAVSRHHAELVVSDGQWLLRDLKSRNGVLVNGERISEATLADGDVITVGETSLRYEEMAPRGLGPLDWVPLAQLEISWPVGPGPGLQDEPLAGESLASRPVAEEPLLPDLAACSAMRKMDLIRRAHLLQEVHASLLSAPDAAVFWADILTIVRKLTNQGWAGVLAPGGSGRALRLQLHGEGGQLAEAPLLLLGAAARSGEAVQWKALSEEGPEPLKALIVAPWSGEKGPGGLLFGPTERLAAADIRPLLDQMAGLALEIGHWWEMVISRWSGKRPRSPRPAIRPAIGHPPPL